MQHRIVPEAGAPHRCVGLAGGVRLRPCLGHSRAGAAAAAALLQAFSDALERHEDEGEDNSTHIDEHDQRGDAVLDGDLAQEHSAGQIDEDIEPLNSLMGCHLDH